MNHVLTRWNTLDPGSAAREILSCCGSRAWAAALAARRPIADKSALIEASSKIWLSLPESDWQEAFDSHPRIGQNHPQAEATKEALLWSAQEQSTARSAAKPFALSRDAAALLALKEANRHYEERFGRIFIVCASGKTAPEILSILESRLQNDPETELREAAEQQRQITQLRLQRWLESR